MSGDGSAPGDCTTAPRCGYDSHNFVYGTMWPLYSPPGSTFAFEVTGGEEAFALLDNLVCGRPVGRREAASHARVLARQSQIAAGAHRDARSHGRASRWL